MTREKTRFEAYIKSGFLVAYLSLALFGFLLISTLSKGYAIFSWQRLLFSAKWGMLFVGKVYGNDSGILGLFAMKRGDSLLFVASRSHLLPDLPLFNNVVLSIN